MILGRSRDSSDNITAEYIHGNNMDEALQYKYRAMTDPADVLGISSDEVTVDAEYTADSLIGQTLVLWDSDTGATLYTITDNWIDDNDTVIEVDGASFSAFTVANADYVILYQPAAYYYHANVQGNTVAITDANGNIKEEITYDVYGRLTSVKVNGTPLTQTNGLVTVGTYFAGSLTKNPRLFQGRDFDAESGLYYFRNRQYDPVHGRFLTRDPMAYHDSLCLYQFVNNNPVCYVDVYGSYQDAVWLTHADKCYEEGWHDGWSYDWTDVKHVQVHWGGDFIVYNERKCTTMRVISGPIGSALKGKYVEGTTFSIAWNTSTTSSVEASAKGEGGNEKGLGGEIGGGFSYDVETSLGISFSKTNGIEVEFDCPAKEGYRPYLILKFEAHIWEGTYCDMHWFSSTDYNFKIADLTFLGWDVKYQS